MTKLIIDERDLRCTMLEIVRELLGEHHEKAEEIAKDVGDRIVACGDKPSPNAPLDKLEAMIGRMMTTPMRAPARAQLLVEMLTLVNALRVTSHEVDDACPICDFGQESERAAEVIRYSCGHWLKRKREPRVHTECLRMPGGTGPCACLDGCGACDSCGNWLGENDNEPMPDPNRGKRCE